MKTGKLYKNILGKCANVKEIISKCSKYVYLIFDDFLSAKADLEVLLSICSPVYSEEC